MTLRTPFVRSAVRYGFVFAVANLLALLALFLASPRVSDADMEPYMDARRDRDRAKASQHFVIVGAWTHAPFLWAGRDIAGLYRPLPVRVLLLVNVAPLLTAKRTIVPASYADLPASRSESYLIASLSLALSTLQCFALGLLTAFLVPATAHTATRRGDAA